MNARHVPTWFWGLFLLTAIPEVGGGQGPAKLPQVPVARPVVRDMVDYEVFSGRTEAVNRVDLRARVSGYLIKASFVEGADVKKGDVLFEIDPRPYRAEMEKAEANLAVAAARLRLAEAEHKRAAALQGRGLISSEESNKIAAERARAEAGLRIARADRAMAQLNLDFTRVLAPCDGRIGRRLIDPGNLVKADDTSLAVLVSRDPMYVYFEIDERSLLRLRRSHGDGGKAEKTEVDIALGNDDRFSQRGVLDFIDNHLNPESGTVRFRATLANKNDLLAPGMFVRVKLAVGQLRAALVVPARAVISDEGERIVYVLNKENVVEARPVKLGQEHAGLRVVESGLKPNDRVVIGGLGRLGPGMKVEPRLETLPQKQSNEEPDESVAVPLPRGSSGPGIIVETTYPGADAATVSDAVRGPIEQMVGGLEQLRYMRSRCTSDGKLTTVLRFERGSDMQKVQGLTQNQVNRALGHLPEAVKQAGVSIGQGSAGTLLVATLASPENRFNPFYLSNYATIQLKEELERIAGVGEIQLVGQSSYALRIWLDPLRLESHKVGPDEISRLLAREKNLGVGYPERLENIIVRADGEGHMVRLRDIGRVELGPAGGRDVHAILDGRPCVPLVVYRTLEAQPRETVDKLRTRLAELRRRLPEGLALEASFDLTDPAKYLLLDLDFRPTAAAGVPEETLFRYDELLRRFPEVEHVLTLSENPFDLFGSGPCVLIRLRPAEHRKSERPKVIESIRARLADIADGNVRVRDLSQQNGLGDLAYPIDLALDGPEVLRVRGWANAMADRLRQDKRLSDVWINRDNETRPCRLVEINREAAAARGVPISAIMSALQLYYSAEHVGHFNGFGRNWPIEIQADNRRADGRADRRKEMPHLKIRNAHGQMIPLNTLLTIRESSQPSALHFLDFRPMVELTANPAPGTSLAQARKICEATAEALRNDFGLRATYRLTWLNDK